MMRFFSYRGATVCHQERLGSVLGLATDYLKETLPYTKS